MTQQHSLALRLAALSCLALAACDDGANPASTADLGVEEDSGADLDAAQPPDAAPDLDDEADAAPDLTEDMGPPGPSDPAGAAAGGGQPGRRLA
jgi:hypothetical protein